MDIDQDHRDDSIYSANDSHEYTSLPLASNAFARGRFDASFTPAAVQSTRNEAESASKIAKLTKELGRLQNEVSFLKGVMGNEQQVEGPVYLIPAELFYMLKEALFNSFTTIEQHLNLIHDRDRTLANSLRDLQVKATSAIKVNITITPELMTELMECLTESEALQSKIYAYYSASVQNIAQEVTNLLSESYKVLRPLSERSSKFEDEAGLTIWNERRMALATESPSLQLISHQRALLQDFETMKQRLLGQILGIQELMTAEQPGYKTPMRKKQSLTPDTRATRLSSSPSSGDDLRFSLKNAFASLFESLHSTKSEIGKWSWQDSPLRSHYIPRVDGLADVEDAVRVIKHDIEEIAKVVTAERAAIEQRIEKLRPEKLIAEMRLELEAVRKEREPVTKENTEMKALADSLKSQIAEITAKCEKYESALIEQSEKAKCADRLRADNSQLSQELASLKSTYEHEFAHQSAVLTRINTLCDLPESSSLQDLENMLKELKQFYTNEEMPVMEVWEKPMASKYRQCKFLATYADNEANMLAALRYLIEKTEVLMKIVDEDYQLVEQSASTPLHELERREFTLLDTLTVKITDIIAGLITDNETLKTTLETDNQRNEQLKSTISNLQTHLSTCELTINFNSLNTTEEVLAAPSRLYTDITIEERLAKGLDLICLKVAEMGKCEEIPPEDSIEKQKFIYDLLEKIGEDVKRTEETRVELESQQISNAECERNRSDLERQVREGQLAIEELERSEQTWESALMERLETSQSAYQSKIEQFSAKIIPLVNESKAKTQEIAMIRTTLSEKEAENQTLNGILSELQVSLESGQQAWEAALMEKVEASQTANFAKIQQLAEKTIQFFNDFKELKAKSKESETLQAALAEKETVLAEKEAVLAEKDALLAEKEAENQALREAQGNADESSVLQEQLEGLKTAQEELQRELEEMKTANQALTADIERLEGEKQALSEQIATFTTDQEGHLATIAQLEADKSASATEIKALTSENEQLRNQLSVTDVQISLLFPPSEETRPSKYGCSLEEKLVKGFDSAMRNSAEALRKEPTFADTLLEQQMNLSENVDLLCVELEVLKKTKRDDDMRIMAIMKGSCSDFMMRIERFEERVKEHLEGLKGRLREQSSGNREILRLAYMDTSIPQSPVSYLLAKDLDEMLMRAARAINKIPIYPPMLADKVACLKDFITEFARSVRNSQSTKELRDEGLTYMISHGSNELIANRLSL
jgi:hypothetical protein